MLENREDWKTQEHECAHCGWQGPGTALIERAMSSDFFEICCPQCEQAIALAMDPGALLAVRERQRARGGA